MYTSTGLRPLAAPRAAIQQLRSRPHQIRIGLGLAVACTRNTMASVAATKADLAPSGPHDAAAAPAAASTSVAKPVAAPPVHSSLHATGQPDTPMEVITDLLRKAQGCSTLEECQIYVQRAVDISSGLDMYMEQMSSPPPQVVRDLVKASEEHDWQAAFDKGATRFLQKRECCAGVLEGRLLRMLVAATRAKSVLEIGMFTGTSTLSMAEALPSDGKIVALDIEPYMEQFSAPYFTKAGLADRIQVVVGSAQESLQQLARKGQRFDLIFLDANKDGYLSYYQSIMDLHLLLPGGLLLVDNSLMKGRVYAPGPERDEAAEAIAAFNKVVVGDPRVEVVLVPFRDGISLIQHRRPVMAGAAEQGADLDPVVTGHLGNDIFQRFKLNGQAALITGAAQGIGRAWAHALGEAGAAVAVVDVDLVKAQATAAELAAKGIKAVAVQADVSSKKDCERMVAEVVEGLGRLDIAVNNAGINRNSAAEDTGEGEWDATFAVNTKGVFLCCQAEAAAMFSAGRGKIINTASMASLLVPHPQKQAAYNASKAAVVKLTQSLAAEWADRGVTVNCVSPGIVNTALIQESPALAPLVKEWLAQIPTGRLAEVTDLQAAIVYLASAASDYMTGHNLVIEGGQSLW